MNTIVKNIQKAKDNGKIIMGSFPLYPPVELFHSLGITTVVLWNLKNIINNTNESDRHIQNYACSISRHAFEFIYQNKDLFNGLFMYNACDTIRNLPEIVELSLKKSQITIPFFKLHVPASNRISENNIRYLANRINTLINELENNYNIKFSKKKFQESIELFDELRDIVNKLELYAAKGKIKYCNYLKICQEAAFLTIEEQINLFSNFLEQADIKSYDNNNCMNVMISGIIPPSYEICEAIENANLKIVKNDIASINRFYNKKIKIKNDPIKYYEQYYFNHCPCPTIMNQADNRMEYLLDIIEKNNIKGFIFLGEKFCEYEWFEYPYIEESLKQKGIKTLFLELSIDDNQNIGSYITKIETFAQL